MREVPQDSMSVREISRRFQIRRQDLYAAIRSGELRAFRIGGRRRYHILRRDWEQFLDQFIVRPGSAAVEAVERQLAREDESDARGRR